MRLLRFFLRVEPIKPSTVINREGNCWVIDHAAGWKRGDAPGNLNKWTLWRSLWFRRQETVQVCHALLQDPRFLRLLQSIYRPSTVKIPACELGDLKLSWQYPRRVDLHKLSAVDATSFTLHSLSSTSKIREHGSRKLYSAPYANYSASESVVGGEQ